MSYHKPTFWLRYIPEILKAAYHHPRAFLSLAVISLSIVLIFGWPYLDALQRTIVVSGDILAFLLLVWHGIKLDQPTQLPPPAAQVSNVVVIIVQQPLSNEELKKIITTLPKRFEFEGEI